MSFGSHAEYGDLERRQAQYNAAIKGGAKGAAMGASVAIPAAYILHQRWAPFRGLTLPLKAFFVTSATIAAGVIAADKSGIAFDHEHYSDEGAKKLRQYRTHEDQEWAELSTPDKALTWAKDNKFGVVAGSWIASMGGIFAYIHNQPMSFAQKLVQTRVWAQGLTLGSLLAMAAITQIPSAGDKILKEREHSADHSWRDFIGESSADPSNSPSRKEGGSEKGGRSKEQKGSSSSGKAPNPAQSSDPDHSSSPKPSAKPNQSSSGQQGNSAAQAKQSETSASNQNPASKDQSDPDPSDKSSRSASPTAPKEKAQSTKASASQTGKKGGYSGDN